MSKNFLYRFQPVSVPGDDRLSSLKNDRFWFSDPARFNDPFDLKPILRDLVPSRWCGSAQFIKSMRLALGEILENSEMYQGALFINSDLFEVFKEWANDHEDFELNWSDRLSNAIQNRIDQFGVACLTPNFDSRLMWAHYANNGQGFCIEYEVDWCKQEENIRYVPVQYSSVVPELCISEAFFTPHQFLQRVMASKHADWAYEQEIRLVCLTDKGKSINLSQDFVRMTKLIAGHAMPEPLRDHLKSTAAQLNVKASEMTIRHGSFQIRDLI